MTTQLHLDTIEPFYGNDDEWRVAIQDSIDGLPSDYPRLLTDEQIEAELMDLREGVADDQWHSRGQW